MTTKNPETLQNSEILELKHELGNLERDVSGKRKIFEIPNFNKVLEDIQARKPISLYCIESRTFEEKALNEATGTWKKIINGLDLQGRRFDINMKAHIGYFFDIETATCSVEKKNGKGIFHVKLKKKPETTILDVETKILKEGKAVKIEELDDFGEKCVNILKEEMVREAKEPDNIKKAEEGFKKEILSTLKATGFVDSQVIIKPEDVQDIVIEYEN